jgi:predicted ribosomally synthesized peptide with nif11-like leader
MSVAAAEAFRQLLNEDPSLREPFLTAYETSAAAVIELGHSRGFDFTEAELLEELARLRGNETTAVERELVEVLECRQGDELSDAELDLVSAGGTPSCTTTDTGNARP